MIKHDLETQLFYLNRIFEILSDGYMLSIISFYKTSSKGDPNIPFTQISDNYKRNIKGSELKSTLDYLFDELYNHSKQFTSAPEIFNQSWNNEYVLKSIAEAKNNIIVHARNTKKMIKTSNNIEKDHFQVIEFICEDEEIKEVLFFQTWFH